MKKIALIIPLGKNNSIEYLDSINKQSKFIKIYPVYGNNPSKNRNIGVKKSKEPLVAFINGHTLLSKDWAKKIISFFNKNDNVDILGGPQLTKENASFFEEVSGVALQSKFGSANVSSRYKGLKGLNEGNEFNLTSANLICKRSVFNKIKFDENVYPGEDPKFLRDAKRNGLTIKYHGQITVFNKRRKTFKNLAKQIFSYGETRAKSELLRSTLIKPAFIVPSIFLLYLLFIPTLMAINSLFIIPLMLYIIINLLFSLYESSKSSIFYLLLLPFTFITIHLSYGAGFIYGKFSKL